MTKGRYFTPPQPANTSDMTYCIINGHQVEASQASISIQDRGFRFGDGLFETIAVTNGVPYQFEWHLKRLENGLNAIKIQYDTSKLHSYCRDLLHHNAVMDGLLRIQITRGSGSKGYLPSQATPTLVIETPHKPEHGRDFLALWKSTTTKMSPRSLPVQFKLCQGLNSTLARMEAAENDCFDSLMLNEAGHLCETSSGNIFWRKDGTIFTPALSCGVLEGSTRAALLRLLPSVRETEATMGQLLNADAVCATNVVWRAVPVGKIKPQNKEWDSESFAQELTALLDQDRIQYSESHAAHWR